MDKKKNGKGLTRRQFLKTTAAGGALTAAGVLGFPYVSRAANKKIKVGMALSYSGVFSMTGQRADKGIRYAFANSKWKDNVEFFPEDTQLKPEVAMEKMQKLVEKVGADILVGPIAGHEALAASEYCKSKKRLMLLVYGGNVKIAGSNCSRYTFLCGHTTYSVSAPGVPWCMDNLGKNLFLLGSDYSTGRDICEYFKQGCLKKGGKIVGEAYPPLGATEFAPFLTQIMNASPKPNLAGGFIGGSDLISLTKQSDEFGLKKQGIPIVTSIGSYTETICKAIGDAAIGNYDVAHWTPVLKHKENVEFLAGYEKLYNEKADDSSVLGFDTGTVMTRALDQTGGDTDNEKLIDVIAKLKWVGPRGECSFGPNHAIIHPTYVRRVEKVGGVLLPIVAADLGPHTTPGGPDGPGGECKM